MTHKKIVKVLLGVGVLGTMGTAGTALASGFQIFDQDAAQLGNYYAGGATGTDSAGSEFYNPATLTQFDKPQIELGLVDIRAYVDYSGQVRTLVDGYDLKTTSGNVGAGGPNYVPDMHLVLPISKQWAFGFGTTVPFGLETDYPAGSFAASAATVTTVKTVDLNPSIAYRANKYFSVGFGVDAEYATGEFDQMLSFPDLGISSNAITNKMHDWGYGWNAGVLIQPTNVDRIGLSYRSGITHKAQGSSTVVLTRDNGTVITGNGPANVTIPLPATSILSVAHDFSKWTVMASAFYTQWDSVQQLTLNGVEVVPGTKLNITLPENFRNTWNFALGTNYHFAERWTWQLGVGYDQSPVNSADRDIRLPDSNRRILATGLGYKPMANMTINAGYAHFYTNPASINHAEESMKLDDIPLAITEQGMVNASADVFGLSVNYSF